MDRSRRRLAIDSEPSSCVMVLLVGLLLIALPSAHATPPARPFGVVPHKDNTQHIDSGVATNSSPFFPSRASTAGRKTMSDQFDSPEICGGCHIEIYAQWKGSMMANAWTDPIYRAVLNAVSKATGGKVDKFCMGCHTPVGVVTGEAKPSGEGMSEIAGRGVQCDVCHNISDTMGIGNGAYVLTPKLYGRPLKFGPFKDAISPYHDTAFSPLHVKSEFCGQCHNVTHPFNLLPIERTYDEWRDSPYAGMNVQCQDCHMKPAPGRATPFSREREQIHAHYIVGGNMLVPKMLGSEKHSKLAEEMLQSAAKLEIFAPSSLVAGAINKVRVRVTNVGAGHKLPTGFPEGREMWIDFRVMDGAGRTLYRLGEVRDGYTEEGTKSFKVVLGDKDSKVVDLNPIDADRILFDNRIPAKSYDDTEFSFLVPGDLQGKLQIIADLNYWSFPQGFLDQLMGKDAPTVPIAKMARASVRSDAVPASASTASPLAVLAAAPAAHASLGAAPAAPAAHAPLGAAPAAPAARALLAAADPTDPVPREEPLHPTANKWYGANGRLYRPITDDRDFKERGKATVIAADQEGKPTASGESYSQRALTAAHSRLPIPSYARVTDLRTGKSAIVRISDRGAYDRDAEIAVSPAVAQKIGLLGNDEVEVERITPARTATMPATRADAAPPAPEPAPAASTSLPVQPVASVAPAPVSAPAALPPAAPSMPATPPTTALPPIAALAPRAALPAISPTRARAQSAATGRWSVQVAAFATPAAPPPLPAAALVPAPAQEGPQPRASRAWWQSGPA